MSTDNEMMSSESSFGLRIDGSGIVNGEIDINDLAPALIALGEILQAANRATNPQGAVASVKVKAVSHGCFSVDLLLQLQDAIANSPALLDLTEEQSQRIANADGILSIVANGAQIIGGTLVSAYAAAKLGAFMLLKQAAGSEIKAEKTIGNGDVEVNINGNIYITSEDALRLTRDPAFRKSANKFVSVLERPGIDSLVIEDKYDNFDPIEFTEQDIQSFGDLEFEEQLDSNDRKVNLQIVSIAFNQDNKWRFTDGGDPFWASIDDPEYLDRINSGLISFRKNDYLICEMREVQAITEKGLKMERSIIRVYEHKSGWEQLDLFR